MAPTFDCAMAVAMLIGLIVDAVVVAIDVRVRRVRSSIEGSVNRPDGVRTIPTA